MSLVETSSASADTRVLISDVVLIEDNPIDRLLVAESFSRHFKATRWRHFSNGRVALDNCLASPPALLLLDLLLPDINGLDILKILRQDGHAHPVLVLTNFPSDTLPRSLLQLSANGYLDKQSVHTHLATAIQDIMDGRMFFSAASSPPFERQPHPVPVAGRNVLSKRETEIARLVTHGFVSKQIADRLRLSVRTVENHRARILGKLKLINTADLVRWCLSNDIG